MKRRLLLCLFIVSSSLLFASDGLDVYTYIYRNAFSASERLAILKNVSDAQINGAGQLYAEALQEILLEYPSLQTNSEKNVADQTARLLASLLGDAKYSAAAGDLWNTVQTFSNPLVKADALIALGRIRAPAYLEQVIKLLNDLNLEPSADPETGGKIAYGAILALEKYQDSAAYIPVFLASNGWYSKRVKDQALAALPYIAPDPSQPISDLIESSSYTYDVKYTALQRLDESNATAESKAAVAVKALGEAWRHSTRDVKQKIQLGSIRKLSIHMLNRYRTEDPTAVELLDRSSRNGMDMDEQLNAVSTLGSIATEESVMALSLLLADLNTKRSDGNITQEDERMVRAVIPALGSSGLASASPALQSIEHTDWTNAIKRMAAEALRSL